MTLSLDLISGTSQTVLRTQNLERNVPNTAHKNVSDNSLLLGTLFLLAFPVYDLCIGIVFEKTQLGAVADSHLHLTKSAFC